MSLAKGADLISLYRQGDEALPRAVEMAARWIAKLHSTAILCPPARTMERQALKVNRVASQMQETYPALLAKAQAVAGKIINAISGGRAVSFTPIHGDFLLKNVIADGGTLTAIDFEEGGWFDPAKDVGKFLGSLEVKGAVHNVGFDVRRLQQRFVNAYLQGSGRMIGRRVAAYHAISLLKHARRQATREEAAAWLDR